MLCSSNPVAAQGPPAPEVSLASSITIGGSGTDSVTAIAVDDAGYAYVAGKTDSADFPVTASAFQGTRRGTRDAFVVKIAPDGRTVVFATYIGGSGTDEAVRVSVDGAGAPYLVVESTSTDYPGAPDASCASGCTYITKLSPDAGSVAYSHKTFAGVEFVVSRNGTTFFTAHVSTGGTCSNHRLYALSPAGEPTNDGNALISVGGCEPGQARITQIATGPSDDVVAVLVDTFLQTTTALRLRSDGTVLFSTPRDGVFGVAALTRDATGGAVGAAMTGIHGVSADGTWQPDVPLQLAAEWGGLYSVGPLRHDASGALHSVFCHSRTTITCRYTTLDASGAVTGSVVVGDFPYTETPPQRHALGPRGQAFVASGTANITVQQFARAVIADFTGSVQTRFGTPITWTAEALATNAEYKFVRRDPAGLWRVERDWASTPAYTWLPGYADRGTHDMQVWIRAPGSTNLYDDWRGARAVVVDGPLPTLTGVIATTPPYHAGEALTWRADAVGGAGVPYFAFHRLDADGWHLVQPYSTNNIYTWIPAPGDAGAHALQVWVRNGDSLATFEAWQGTTFNVAAQAAPLQAVLVASGPIPAAEGGSGTWLATARGGTGPLQYQFWRLAPNGQWSLAQDYSPRDSYTWRPGALDAGPNALQVWVRNAGSTAMYDAWAGTGTFTVWPAPPLTVAFTSAPIAPLTTQRQYMWTAQSSRTTSQVQYQFLRRDDDGWHVAAPYSSSPLLWTPGSGDVGRHDLQVWARRVGSTAAYDAWASVATFDVVPVGAPLQVTSLSANSIPQVNRLVEWRASISGGSTSVEYQFLRLDADGWHVVQSYSSASSYGWIPRAADVGDHALQVWVRNSGSSQPYDTWASVTFTVPDPTPHVQIEQLGPMPSLDTGATVSWRASARNGVAPYLYRFARLDADGWHLVQDYSSRDTYSWSPTAADVGTHTIQVWVRNWLSTTDYDGWAEFTVVVPPARDRVP